MTPTAARVSTYRAGLILPRFANLYPRNEKENLWNSKRRPGRDLASDRDHELAARSTLSQLPDGVRGPVKRKSAIDDGLHLARLHELAHGDKVVGGFFGDKRTQILSGEEREQRRPEDLTVKPSEDGTAAFAAHDDKRSLRRERLAKHRQRPATAGVEDDVVSLATLREILPRVVDDVVGADRA